MTRNKILKSAALAVLALSVCSVLWIFVFGTTRTPAHNNSGAPVPVESSVAVSSDVVVEDPRVVAARELAKRLADSLDDNRLASQVLIYAIDGRNVLTQNMRTLLGKNPPGATIFFRYNLNIDNDSIRSMLTEIARIVTASGGVPPFQSVDHEGGNVNRFRRGVATLPAQLTYWELAQKTDQDSAVKKIEEDGFEAARQINKLGFNFNYAPVAEHLVDANRAFLGTRSYGPDPVFAAAASAAFVRGMERGGVLCVVKHFPGNAGADPHYHPSVLDGDRAAIEKLVAPFTALINDGKARAIMVAHTKVPVVDNEIASLSSIVMNDWLRGELGFNGIIVSDDFAMAAAASGPAATTRYWTFSMEEATVRSLIAGADMIMVWPQDIPRVHRAISDAIKNGRLSRERLREASGRIIFEKIMTGLVGEV